MLIYHINLLLILGLAYPLCIRKPSRRKSLVYICVTFGFMFFLVSVRFGIGHDYTSYIQMYERAAATPIGEIVAVKSIDSGSEMGYMLLLKLLAALGCSNIAMYTVMGALCLAPVAWFIYRYSPNLWLSTWLFATLTFFYSTMNFIRQDISMCILLLGYPLLRKRKVWSTLCYLGVILVAASFHSTALILMIPILCVCYLPPKWWLYGSYAVVTLVVYAFSHQIVEFVTKYLYSKYEDTIYLNIGLGYHFLIIPALILTLVVACKKWILEKYPQDGALLINMTLYGALIWLFVTHHFILERFSLFVWIYVLLSVPMATECVKPDPEKIARAAELQTEVKQLKANKTRNAAYLTLNKRYMDLSEDVRTRWILYWCLIAAILIATFCYNVFGMTDGTPRDGRMGFHGVFPYRSVIRWLNLLP